MFETFLNHLNNLIKNLTVLKLNSLTPNRIATATAYLFHISSEGAHSLEIKKQSLQQLAQLKQLSINKEHREKFFSLTRELLQFSQVSHTKKWRTQVALQFTQTANWENYHCQLPEKSSILNQLHAYWRKYYRYALFSTPDLIRIYWQQLIPFEEWLLSVQNEFLNQKKHLSKKDRERYKEKFQILLYYIQIEKTTIRRGLIGRVELGIKQGDLRFDDTITTTAHKLKQLGLLTSVKLPFGIYRHLTPEIFAYIQQIITIDGNIKEKNQLADILYAKHTPMFAFRKNSLGIIFAIPAGVTKLISPKTPFYTKLPQWLHIFFRQTKIIYEFFQDKDCQFLITAQQVFSNLTLESGINISNLRHATSWDYLKYLTKIIEKERNRQQIIRKDFLTSFQSDTQQILEHHQKFLNTFSQTIFNKQAFIFEKIIWQLENQSKIRTLTEKEKLQLEDIKTTVSSTMQLWHSQWNESDLTVWDTLKNRYQQLLTPLPKTVSIKTYSDAINTLNHNIAQQKLLPTIKIELAKNSLILSTSELTNHITNIKAFFEEIKTTKITLVHPYELQTDLYNYIKNLLITIQNLPNQNALIACEEKIQLILDTFTQLDIDKVLKNELQQLIKNIKQFSCFHWELFLELAITPPLNALEKTLQNTAQETINIKKI